MTHTIGMISLGCAKNQVNAEHMLWLLRQAGYEISPDPDGAELVIVNTCGFIESAKTEAIDNILAMAQLKAEGRIQKILVTFGIDMAAQDHVYFAKYLAEEGPIWIELVKGLNLEPQ